MSALTGHPAKLILASTVLVGAVLTGCLFSENVVESTTGKIDIRPNPSELDAAWALTGPSGRTVQGAGSLVLQDMAPGQYELMWGTVPGYDPPTPNPMTQMLEPGNTAQFAGNYPQISVETGSIAVSVAPAALASGSTLWTLEGPGGFVTTGGSDALMPGRAIGNYSLTWAAVSGWDAPTPNPQTGSLSADAQLDFEGTYTQITAPMGSVLVNPGPDDLDAPWRLTGPGSTELEGEGETLLEGRAVGDYTVEWLDYPGWIAPSSTSGTLAESATLELAANYTADPDPVGTVNIDITPNQINADWTLQRSGGSPQQGSGDETLTDLPTGQYTLTFEDVEDYLTPLPNPRQFTLDPDETQNIAVTYEEDPGGGGPSTGTVVVDPRPESINAPWNLSGPSGYSTSGSGKMTLQDLDVGDYTVSWQSVSGWQTPNPSQQSLTLLASQTLTFIAVYGDPNGPSISSIAGSATDGGTITLSGDGFGSNPLDIEWLGGADGPLETMPNGAEIRVNSTDSRWTEPGWYANPGIAPSTGVEPNVSSEFAHSGNKSLKMYGWDGEPPGAFYRPDSDPGIGVNRFEEVWFSSWVYFDPISNDGSEASQWKIHTIQVHDTGSVAPGSINWNSNWRPSGQINNHTLQIYPTSTHDWGCDNYPCRVPVECWPCAFDRNASNVVQENDYIYFRRDSHGSVSTPPLESNRWMRIDMWAKVSSNFDTWDGKLHMRVLRPGSSPWTYRLENVATHSSQPNQSEISPWLRSWRSVWWKNQLSHAAGRATIWTDDHYIQFGSPARVEIGDNPNYDSCTQLELQEPTDWSNGEITIKVNHGGFSSGQSRYIFVVRGPGDVTPGQAINLQ